MTPYARTDTFVVANAAIFAVMKCPGRCTLKDVRVVEAGGSGTFTLDLYSRAFTGPVTQIEQILNDGTNHTQLVFNTVYGVNVGDILAITGATNGGYNTSHMVTEVIDDFNVVTNQTFVANDVTASATLAIPSSQWPLYKVGATLSGSSSNLIGDPDVDFINTDPQTNLHNRGYPRKLYLKFSEAGTFTVQIRTSEGIAVG